MHLEMQCKSLWIKASAKCVNVNVDVFSLSFRFNLAEVNDSDVGLKTDLITINPSQIRSVHTHNKNTALIII